VADNFFPGLPLPFECVYSARVSNCAKVKNALHSAFEPDRVNRKREFFEIEAAQAVAIIKRWKLKIKTHIKKAAKSCLFYLLLD
jgi:hypothetical protein